MTPTSSSPAHDVPPPDLGRHGAAALAAAITRGWRPYRWRGYAVGGVAGILVGGVAAPIVTTSVGLGLWLAGAGIDAGLPWAEAVWSVAFVVTFAAVGAWAVAAWLPPSFQEPLESYVWLASRAEADWHRTFGGRSVPRSASALRAFVDSTPETAETAGERGAAWLALGDVGAARRCVSQMPSDTPAARYRRDGSAWLVELVGGTVGDLTPLRNRAAEIEDPADRLEAEADLAANEARVELAAGRDWRPPLAAVRGRLGPEPRALVRRLAWRPTFLGMLAAGAIGVGVWWVATAYG